MRISPEEARLVEIGAAYHDIGFVVQRQEHERAGAEIAAQVLPGFGLTSEQVAVVQGMILATRLPQFPARPSKRSWPTQTWTARPGRFSRSQPGLARRAHILWRADRRDRVVSSPTEVCARTPLFHDGGPKSP